MNRQRRNDIVRGLAAVVAGATFLGGGMAAASPEPGVERPGVVQAWAVDGRLVAVRRSPLPALTPNAYGGHGVDYAPVTWPVVRR